MKFKYTDQLLGELKALKNGYPAFVISSKTKLLKNEIPVFVFHSFEPDSFEEQLKYLSDNSYYTLSANEYSDTLEGKREPLEKSVLITIDDARTSFWLFGFPLLKKYNMKATLFVIAGHTLHNVEPRKNLEDVWKGNTTTSFLKQIDPEDNEISGWNELKLIYKSGLIDVEIHTLFHKEIFTNLVAKDFIDSETSLVPYNSPASPYLTDSHIGKGFVKEELIGLPLFDSKPLMEGVPEIQISDSVLKESRKMYSEISKNGKVNQKAKEDALERLNLKLIYEEKIFKDPYENILNDLKKSQDLLRKNIDEKCGFHLCLPWTLGSSEVIEACRELKIRTCFWGIRNDRKINKPGDDPFYSCRIKNDFVFRLPGERRKSLPSIYGAKIKRRLSNERVF